MDNFNLYATLESIINSTPAFEDKEELARELTEALQEEGLDWWAELDGDELVVTNGTKEFRVQIGYAPIPVSFEVDYNGEWYME